MHRVVCPLLLISMSLFGRGADAAQENPVFAGEFEPEYALINLYGAAEWRDARLRAYDQFSVGYAHVETLLDEEFEEGGKRKHLVIAALTPRKRQEFSCRACAPLIGGAIFRQEGDLWFREAAGQIIQLSGADGASFKLMPIGPDRVGLLHHVDGIQGGYESRQATLIFAIDGELAVRFRTDEFAGPGPGACPVPEQHLHVRTEEAEVAQQYFDLVVDVKWNDATCQPDGQGEELLISPSGRECRRIMRYRYRDQSYQLLATEADECTPLKAEATSLAG